MTTRQFLQQGRIPEQNELPQLRGSPNEVASMTLDVGVPQISIGYKGKIGSQLGGEATIDVPVAFAFTGEGRISLNGKFKGKTTFLGQTIGAEAELSGGVTFSKFRPDGFDANGRITGGWTPERKDGRDGTTKYGQWRIPKEYGEKIGSGALVGAGFSFKGGKFAWEPAAQVKRSSEGERRSPQQVNRKLGVGVVTLGAEGKLEIKSGAFNNLDAIRPALQGNKLTDSRTGKAAQLTVSVGGKFYADFPLPTPWGVVPTTIQLKVSAGTIKFAADGESKIYIVNPFNRNAKPGEIDLVKLYRDVHQELKKRLPFIASGSLLPEMFQGSIINLEQAEQFAYTEFPRRLQDAQGVAELSMAADAMRMLTREDLRAMDPETLARFATGVNVSLYMLERLSPQEIRDHYSFLATYVDPMMSAKAEWFSNEMANRNDQIRGIEPNCSTRVQTNRDSPPERAESREVLRSMSL
jgi:hypothetical protein